MRRELKYIILGSRTLVDTHDLATWSLIELNELREELCNDRYCGYDIDENLFETVVDYIEQAENKKIILLPGFGISLSTATEHIAPASAFKKARKIAMNYVKKYNDLHTIPNFTHYGYEYTITVY